METSPPIWLQYGEEWDTFAIYVVVFYSSSNEINHRRLPRGCRRNSWRGCSICSECCKGRWIAANITGLQPALRRRVFGQHLVTETVLKAIVGHLNNKSPRKALDCKTVGFFLKISKEIGKAWRTSLTRAKRAYAKIRTVLQSRKALALSFNGWTGSGKNFVSKILQSIFLGRGWKVNLSIKSLPPMTSHTSRNWTVINDICVVWGRMEKQESGIRNPESGIRNPESGIGNGTGTGT